MEKISDIQSKIFLECKDILTTISEIETKEALISKQNLFYEIIERISFLKFLEKNDWSFIPHQAPIQDIDKPDEKIKSVSSNGLDVMEYRKKVIENQQAIEEQITENPIETIEKVTSQENEKTDFFRDETKDEDFAEKKIKLSNIKKIQPQSLFSEEILHQNGNDFVTNTIEQSKKEREFKLDLNDRIAFTKILFNGSQLELKETINTLNTFTSLDEAKEYLSDMYYEKKWDKVDEYAQRLWILVESKFL